MFIVGFVLVAIVKKRYIEEYPLLECPFYLFDVWFGINLEFERRVFLVNVFFLWTGFVGEEQSQLTLAVYLCVSKPMRSDNQSFYLPVNTDASPLSEVLSLFSG